MKSSIFTPVNLHEFMVSKRGHIDGRQGLSLGAVTGILAGAAVLFGAADKAQADYCYGIPNGSCGWACPGTNKEECDTTPPDYYYYGQWYCHDWPTATGCYHYLPEPGGHPCNCP